MPAGFSSGPVVGTARVRLELDDRRFQRDVGRASTQTKRGFESLSRGALFALGGIATGALGAIKAASDLGEQVNKTSVVFGRGAPAIQRWAKTTADSIGISNRAALEAAGTFGNMLVPMGFARVEAAGMSKRMVQLAADMASFNNASPEETLDALRAGLAGETEPLRRFGVFLNDARLKQEAMNLGLKNAVGPNGALTANAKAQATYSVILKDTADSQGDFARTSDSAANAQRMIRAQLEDTAATLGTQLLPAAERALGVTSDLIRFTGEHEREAKILAVTIAGLSGAMLANAAATRTAAASMALYGNAMRGLLFLRAHPILLVAGGIAAALVALDRWRGSQLDTIGPTEAARQSIDGYRRSLDALEAASERAASAERRRTGAELDARGASLGFERALLSRKQARQELARVEDEFGRKSTEYRDAALRVKEAELRVAEARRERGRATRQLRNAEADVRRGESDHIEALRQTRSSGVQVQQQMERLNRFYRGEYRAGLAEVRRGHRENNEIAVEYGNARMRNAVEGYADRLGGLARLLRREGNPQMAKAAENAARLTRQLNKVPTPKEVDVRVRFKFIAGKYGMGVAKAEGDGFGDGAVNTIIGNATTGYANQVLRSGAVTVGRPRGDVSPGLWDELALAAAFGLNIVSTYRGGATTRTGNKSLHSYFPARAFDAAGSASSMLAFAAAVYGRPGLSEVLYSGYGPTTASHPGIRSDHYDHVHVGAGWGDGAGLSFGGGSTSTRRPRTGDGLGVFSRPNLINVNRQGRAMLALRTHLIPASRRKLRTGEVDVRYRSRLWHIPKRRLFGRPDPTALPIPIQLAQAQARLTPDTADDLAAARREEAVWRSRLNLKWLNGVERVQITESLASILDELAQPAEEVDETAQRIEARDVLAGFFREFASNIFSPGAGGGLTFGSTPGGSGAVPPALSTRTSTPGEGGHGGPTTVVNQFFNKPPEDNHPLLRSAEFAARNVFG